MTSDFQLINQGIRHATYHHAPDKKAALKLGRELVSMPGSRYVVVQGDGLPANGLVLRKGGVK